MKGKVDGLAATQRDELERVYPRIFRAVLHRCAMLPAQPLHAGFPSLSFGAVQAPAGPVEA